MSGLVRRGGRGTLPDGATLTWSVAEGGRGRRWRAAVVADGRLQRAILIETGADRRLTRLEVEDAFGLLTLHPDEEGSVLHGNVVALDGIRHLTLGWSPAHVLLVAPVAFSAAPVAWRLGTTVAVGERAEVGGAFVDDELDVEAAAVRLERHAEGEWAVTVAEGPAHAIGIDVDGLPAGLAGAETWPLERRRGPC